MGREGQDSGLRGFDAYDITLGDHLRGERATLGKSLLDVQRDLRIRASYIAAIENADLAVFPNPGFIAGYVRSYARYLNLDPEEVMDRFCRESGFGGVNAGIQSRKSEKSGRIQSSGPLRVSPDDPLLRSLRTPASDLRPGLFERLSLSALGSLAVLALLVSGLGYGGYRVLQNIQRVSIAPVDQRPETLAHLSDLPEPQIEETAGSVAEPAVSDADLARLYQPRELEVPIVASRDGPIVDIDPAQSGLLAPPPTLPIQTATAEPEPEPQVREPAAAPLVHVVARQPAWVRVYLDGGTVLYEKILEAGETYTVPQDVEAPLLRAGNASTVYVLLGDTAYGPLGQGSSVVKEVSLLPDDVRLVYPEVTDPPEVIAATVSALSLPAADDAPAQ